jgi:DNA-binding transcriptional ArsR family regulator
VSQSAHHSQRGRARNLGRRGHNGPMPDLVGQQVRVSAAPLVTVTMLLMETLGDPKGSPPAWYGPVGSSLKSEDLATFSPMVGSRTPRFFPGCLLPAPTAFAPTFEEQLGQVAAVSPDELVCDLVRHDLVDTPWAQVASAPQMWLDAYIACLRRAWTGAQPLWRRAQPLIEREVTRIGAAVVQGTFDVLMGELSPRLTVVDGCWKMTRHEDLFPVAPEIVLVPIVAGPKALFLDQNADDLAYSVAYPLPHAWRSGEPDDRASKGDSLTALLGEPRAGLLRRLEQPVTPGSLAESMIYAPSAISHHLHALEKAGLVERERHGRHILVHRTGRGTALLNLYDR